MNPRVKKIARNILFLLSIPVIIGAFVFAQNSSHKELYKGLQVRIENPELSFVSEQDIVTAIEDEGVLPGELAVKDIDINKLKQVIAKNAWIDQIEIFMSAKQIIHVKVQQKQPVLRVQLHDSTHTEYYLDQEANPFPLSDIYVANVPVVTATTLGYTKDDLNFKTSLVHLCEFIQHDSFWNAACGQLDIVTNNDVRMVPTIGNHTILLGGTEMYSDKLNRLKTFYERGIHTIDWSLYDEVDARYQGQIVCRNSKGLVLAEDPYESVADAQERVRIKTGIERAEQQEIKQKELEEKQKAKAKELKAQQEAKQKILLEKQELQKEKALELKTQQLAKQKEKAEKVKAHAEQEKLKQEKHKSELNNKKSKTPIQKNV